MDLDGPDSSYLTDNIMDHVLEFLDHRHGDPFFLYYAPYAVHTPIQKVDSLMYRFENKAGTPGMSNPEYATMIYNLDRNIGRMVDKLKEMGAYDNTLIIFTSDNGGLFRISEQKPLRAGKGSYYEGGIRVPTFFVWKEHIKSGVNNDVPIVNMDYFPTIMEITGAQLPGKQFDGISLARLLLKGKEPEIRPFYWYFPVYLESGNVDTRDILFRTRPGSVIRYGDWKLQEYFEDGSIELFNLADDPGERLNLAEEETEKVVELMNMMYLWRARNGAKVPSTPNPDYIQP